MRIAHGATEYLSVPYDGKMQSAMIRAHTRRDADSKGCHRPLLGTNATKPEQLRPDGSGLVNEQRAAAPRTTAVPPSGPSISAVGQCSKSNKATYLPWAPRIKPIVQVTLASSFAKMAARRATTVAVQVSQAGARLSPSDHPHPVTKTACRSPAKRIQQVDDSCGNWLATCPAQHVQRPWIAWPRPQVEFNSSCWIESIRKPSPTAAVVLIIRDRLVSGLVETYEEGCLSIPGVLSVVRPKRRCRSVP